MAISTPAAPYSKLLNCRRRHGSIWRTTRVIHEVMKVFEVDIEVVEFEGCGSAAARAMTYLLAHHDATK